MSTDGPVSNRKKTFLSVLMPFIQSEVLSSCHFDFVPVILTLSRSFWFFSCHSERSEESDTLT